MTGNRIRLAAAFVILLGAACAGMVSSHAADTLRSVPVPARLSVAYLLKIRDVPGLRGVADSVDRAHARRLDEANRSAVYFRVADSAWVTHDDTTIAEVRNALDSRALAEHRLRNAQGGSAVQQERRDMERRFQDLARRMRDLDAERSLLRAEIDRTRKSGQDTRALITRQTSLDNRLAGLRRERNELERAGLAVARREAPSRSVGRESRQAQMRTAHRVVRAMRRAIERGRAEPFEL